MLPDQSGALWILTRLNWCAAAPEGGLSSEWREWAAAGGAPAARLIFAWRPLLWFCHDPAMTVITAAGAAELDAALNRFVTRDGRPGAAAGC